MKTKFLTLSNPCTENWEKMKSHSDGKFCDLCAKTVIDLTKMDQFQIARIMKEAKGGVCGRVTREQLNMPLPDLTIPKEFDLPYSNIAAGLMIASTLMAAQPSQAENLSEKIEFVQTPESAVKNKNEITNRKPSGDTPKPNDFVIFKGKVGYYEKNETPIENAKITFVTVKKTIVTYTLSDGTFSMKIPSDLIDNDNVVRVTYNEIKNEKTEKFFSGYETKDYILTKEKILSNYQIIANVHVIYNGGLMAPPREEQIPVVISNGIEIDYKEFIKAQSGQKSSCSMENKTYLYFTSGTAIAIYGEKARYGLYILTDKTEK